MSIQKIGVVIFIICFWAVMMFFLFRWEIYPEQAPPVDIESLLGHKIRKETRVYGIFFGEKRIGTSKNEIHPLPSGVIQYSTEFDLNHMGMNLEASLSVDIGVTQEKRVIEKMYASFDLNAPLMNVKVEKGEIHGVVSGRKLILHGKYFINKEPNLIHKVIDNFDSNKMIGMMFTPLISKEHLKYGDEWETQKMGITSFVGGGGSSYIKLYNKVTDVSTIKWAGEEIDIFEIEAKDEKGKTVSIAKVSKEGEVLEQVFYDNFIIIGFF